MTLLQAQSVNVVLLIRWEAGNEPMSDLDGRESLLCAVLDRTSAALCQIARSVLGLWLHQDFKLLSITSLGELSRQ